MRAVTVATALVAVCLLLLASAFSPQPVLQAQTLTPAPLPTPTPQRNSQPFTIITEGTIMNTNYAVLPDDWDLTYGSGPQIIYLDTSVYRSSPSSIRLEKHVAGVDVNSAREVNTAGININVGDRLVFSGYMKTGTSEFGDTGYCGARIGIDFYGTYNGTTKRITGLQSDGANGIYPNESAAAILAHYVAWGSDWTQRTIDYTVPATIMADGSGHPQGAMCVPIGVILWLQVWSSTYGSTDSGLAYFDDTTFYINPEEEAEGLPVAVSSALLMLMRNR